MSVDREIVFDGITHLQSKAVSDFLLQIKVTASIFLMPYCASSAGTASSGTFGKSF